MSRAFKLPDLGEGIHEAEVVAILVKVGDQVQEGQPFMEVETDKARVEIPSPFTGTVEEIKVSTAETVRVGEVLMVFGDGASQPAPRSEMPSADVAGAGTAEEKVSRGGAIPASPRPVSAGAESPVPAEAQPVEPARNGPVPASPSTRRLARELGVDLRQVSPSGPADMVMAEDVRAFAERNLQRKQESQATPPEPTAPRFDSPEPAVGAPVSASPGPSLPDFARWGVVEKMPLRSVRRATAKHMALAWTQIPHVNHQDIADITLLEAYRRGHRAEIEAMGGQLTITVFVIKAVVAALKAHPRFNSSLDMAAEEIILKRYYHLGVAVDTERGLIVPVVRDADRKSIAELSLELKQTADKARSGDTALDEMQGGTFTITNIGALGGTGFAPIINYPEVAILGMGRARLQPVVLGDESDYKIVPRLMMPLVLAFDHRVLDGADAARFMRVVIEFLESPDKLWLRI